MCWKAWINNPEYSGGLPPGTTFNLSPEPCDQLLDRRRTLVAAAVLSDPDLPGLPLTIAHDEHVLDLAELRIADLPPNRLVALVQLRPQPRRAHLLHHRAAVLVVAVGDRQHD